MRGFSLATAMLFHVSLIAEVATAQGSASPFDAPAVITALGHPDVSPKRLATKADSLIATAPSFDSDSVKRYDYEKALKAAHVDPGILWFPAPELEPKIHRIKPPKNVDPKMILPRPDGSDSARWLDVDDE